MTFADGKYGKPRLIEREWLDVLIRFRNSVYDCSSCPNEEFINDLPAKCSACGKPLMIKNQLCCKKYDMPLFPGVRLLQFQTGECADRETLNVVFECKATPDGRYYVTNTSTDTWRCTNTKGNSVKVPPGEIMPVMTGIKAKIFGTEFKII